MRALIAPRLVVQVMVTAILITGVLVFLYLVRGVLLLLLIAIFVAVALGRPVGFLSHRGLPRASAILLVYLLIVSCSWGHAPRRAGRPSRHPGRGIIQILVKEYWHFRAEPHTTTPADQHGRGIDPQAADRSGP